MTDLPKAQLLELINDLQIGMKDLGHNSMIQAQEIINLKRKVAEMDIAIKAMIPVVSEMRMSEE